MIYTAPCVRLLFGQIDYVGKCGGGGLALEISSFVVLSGVFVELKNSSLMSKRNYYKIGIFLPQFNFFGKKNVTRKTPDHGTSNKHVETVDYDFLMIAVFLYSIMYL